ncbi:MAG: purine-nucleoside phosphorylase [Kosmotogaceae bacterium]|nr:purine-nucleoside phosphorylase [Kosmotogaceae bacterium]
MRLYKEMKETVARRLTTFPKVALILGSGLGYLTEQFEKPLAIDYSEIPGFPVTTVEGHSGRLVFGMFHGLPVVAMEGRFHFYEGHNIEDVSSPIYLFKELGVGKLLITNASGGINRSFSPGDIVAVTDIINFGLRNPLRGENDSRYGVRFPDMSEIIDYSWLEVLKSRLEKAKIDLKEGTYCWALGPSYETPAEIRAFEFFGADLVGMSTVPEVIAARHCDIKLLVLSCVTNMASGILKEKLAHSDVVKTANRIRPKFTAIVQHAVESVMENEK